MRMEQIQKAYRAQPFHPFALHLADGRNIRVEHPEFMALSPTGRSVLVIQPDGGYEVVDVLLVTTIKVTNGAQTPEDDRTNDN